eukprot:scaffold925_cov129-Cylindrotheca_fusiformis.AAC.23
MVTVTGTYILRDHVLKSSTDMAPVTFFCRSRVPYRLTVRKTIHTSKRFGTRNIFRWGKGGYSKRGMLAECCKQSFLSCRNQAETSYSC